MSETPEEEFRRIQKEQFFKSNFRSEVTDYDRKVAHIPKALWRVTKESILPDHVKTIQDYVLSWTVGEERKSASHGLILHGDETLCMTYMALILERVFLRRRSIYCESVFNLERECWDRDRLQELGEKVSLLGVYGFPFFLNGLPAGRDDLLVTLFHQMLFNRRNNELPTIFVSHLSRQQLAVAYQGFPAYIKNALGAFNHPLDFEVKK